MPTNNIIRLLDTVKARYTIFILPDRKISAVETAELLSIPVEIVYKTIVLVRSRGKPILCLVPGAQEVNEKAVAALLGEKKVHIASHQEAESLTGLKAGGISPLALINKGFTCIIDESILVLDYVHISAGQIGLNLKINVEDLNNILHPSLARITTSSSTVL